MFAMTKKRNLRISPRDPSQRLRDEVNRIYRKGDEAWSNDDLDAMIALYVPDALLESPLPVVYMPALPIAAANRALALQPKVDLD